MCLRQGFVAKTAVYDQGHDSAREGLDAEDPAALLRQSHDVERRGRVSQQTAIDTAKMLQPAALILSPEGPLMMDVWSWWSPRLPRTLLPQFFGLYAVRSKAMDERITTADGKTKTHTVAKQRKYWIVMTNILASKLKVGVYQSPGCVGHFLCSFDSG